MNQQQDGGPIAPIITEYTTPAGVVYATHGMPLRDYFAAAALNGILASPSHNGDIPDTADDAYRLADAMLERRKEAAK